MGRLLAAEGAHVLLAVIGVPVRPKWQHHMRHAWRTCMLIAVGHALM